MRWRSGCELRGKRSSLILYIFESTHVHNLPTTALLGPKPRPCHLLPSLPLHIPRQQTIKESHDLPQIISSPAPPRRFIHAQSLILGCFVRPNKPNPPHHMPLCFTRPAEHNHHIIDLAPAPSWGELVPYYTGGFWEGFCRWG